MKVKVKVKVKSYPTLRDPMECSLPGSSIHGIFQARGLEWGVIAFSDKSPQILNRSSKQNCWHPLPRPPQALLVQPWLLWLFTQKMLQM